MGQVRMQAFVGIIMLCLLIGSVSWRYGGKPRKGSVKGGKSDYGDGGEDREDDEGGDSGNGGGNGGGDGG